MRRFGRGLLLLTVSACASPSHQLETRSTSFKEANDDFVETAKITLRNVEFQSPRRIEKDFDRIDLKAPNLLLETVAQKAVERLFPELELEFLGLENGSFFSYATFQQKFEGREVFGAKLVLRLSPAGDWVTMSSTAVSPELIKIEGSLISLSREEISASSYFLQPPSLLEQKSVIYPQVSETGDLKVFAARQLSLVDNDINRERIIWIDETTHQLVGSFAPSTSLESTQIKGTISPNAPLDTLTESLFPFALVSGSSGEKVFADDKGLASHLAALGRNLSVKLDNDKVVVVNDDSASSTVNVDTELLTGDSLSIDGGLTAEERNVYYWIMNAKKFLKDRFGFEKQGSKLVAIARFGDDLDNAFFMPITYSLSFGTGKQFLRNTALSRDIVIHEFGHSVVYEKYGNVTGYEFSAMNEAMADFLAAIVTEDPLIADGAMQEKTGMKYLRTVENDFKYPENFTGKGFHNDGQIFSGALWDLRKELGSELADKMIHEAQLAQAKSVYEFYRELLKIDEATDDKDPWTQSKHFDQIRKVFNKHGIGSRLVTFRQAPAEDKTIPWNKGCWAIQ